MPNDEIVKKKINFIKKFEENKFKSTMVNYDMKSRQLNKKDNETNNEVKDLLTKCQTMNLKKNIYLFLIQDPKKRLNLNRPQL